MTREQERCDNERWQLKHTEGGTTKVKGAQGEKNKKTKSEITEKIVKRQKTEMRVNLSGRVGLGQNGWGWVVSDFF